MTDELFPEWADRRATGYDDIGASLPTRDGRQVGNATLVYIGSSPSGTDRLFYVRTDRGNQLCLTKLELEELFWPPTWHQRHWDPANA